MVLASTRHLRSQGPVSLHSHRTEGVTGSEGWKGANGVGVGIGAGGGNGDEGGGEGRNEEMNGDGEGDGAGTGTGMEANEGTQNRNGDGSGDGGEDPRTNIGWKRGRERGRKREQ